MWVAPLDPALPWDLVAFWEDTESKWEWPVEEQGTHPGESSDSCSLWHGHSEWLGWIPVSTVPFTHQTSQPEGLERVTGCWAIDPLSPLGGQDPQIGYLWPLGNHPPFTYCASSTVSCSVGLDLKRRGGCALYYTHVTPNIMWQSVSRDLGSSPGPASHWARRVSQPIVVFLLHIMQMASRIPCKLPMLVTRIYI